MSQLYINISNALVRLHCLQCYATVHLHTKHATAKAERHIWVGAEWKWSFELCINLSDSSRLKPEPGAFIDFLAILAAHRSRRKYVLQTEICIGQAQAMSNL